MPVVVAEDWIAEGPPIAPETREGLELAIAAFKSAGASVTTDAGFAEMKSTAKATWEPPLPVPFWKKVVYFLVLVPLVIFPMMWLLLFGVTKGKATTKSWFISFIIALVLGTTIYEPVTIGLLFVVLPSFIRLVICLMLP